MEDGRKRSEDELPGTVILDIAGCEKLFGTHAKIADDLKRVAEGVGLDANVCIAENPEARRFAPRLGLQALR